MLLADPMSRPKTANLPDEDALRLPASPLLSAVEQALLRGATGRPERAPISARIAVRLATAITLDRIHAGQRLIEQDIGRALQVSRAPVREALRLLERDRLVGFEPRRGAVVTAPDDTELQDLFAIRGALYCLLLEHLMAETPGTLAPCFATHLPRLERAAGESVDAYALEGFLLNMAVFELGTHRLLGDMLKSISLRTLRYVRLGLAAAPHTLAHSVATWRLLAQAITRGDTAAVVATARQRMDTTRDTALRALAPAQGSAPQ